MSQSSASPSLAQVSPSARSPVTLGDFIKRRGGAKSRTSPELRKHHNHRNLFPKDDPIDFSVNDINFEKVQKKMNSKKELQWSQNDVNFTFEMKTCSYQKCLKNDLHIQPFNNFRLPSYSSSESDINFNNEHFFLPESLDQRGDDNSYFRFDRVEVEAEGGQQGLYQGTTYYSLEDQLQDLSTSSDLMTSISDSLGSLDLASRSYDATEESSMDREEDIEKDEELNSLVISIIDD